MSTFRVRSSRARHLFAWLTALLVALPILPGSATSHTSVVSLTDADARILAINSLEDMSDDGRYVLFASDSDSVTDVKPGPFESYLYVRDRQAATTTLVAPAESGVWGAAISNSGSVIAFSTETDLVAADTNGLPDVYVVRDAGPPELVSKRDGVVSETGEAVWLIMSGDGTVAAFKAEAADDPLEGETPGLYRRNGIVADLETGDLERIPFPPVPVGAEVDNVLPIELSDDGQLVLAVASLDTSVGTSTSLSSVTYLWNRVSNAVLVLDLEADEGFHVTGTPRFSEDGSRLRSLSAGPEGSLDQQFVVTTIDTTTGGVVGVLRFDAPETLIPRQGRIPASWVAELSGDGNRVAFYQWPHGSTIWVHDLSSGESIAVVRDVRPDDFGSPMLNVDGSMLAFEQIPSDVFQVVEVVASPVGRSVFSDTGDSIFREDILWLVDQAITRGCTPAGTEFCPDDSVTRGQMAAFINRALELPVSDLDRFTDDDDSIFEADIQALAAAGITMGCNPEGTEFCPDDLVTRGQMAAFLDRALELPASTVDQFTDDDGSIFEANIQALSAAGVTRGCNPEGTLYCPDDFVTRGQMAAFLRRALDDSISTS